jgi:hypothetical protein
MIFNSLTYDFLSINGEKKLGKEFDAIKSMALEREIL